MDHIAHQASLSMGFSKYEYWSGLLCPPPEDLPSPGTEPYSLMSPALAGKFFTRRATQEAPRGLGNYKSRREAITNLDSVLKSRDTTLSTKVHLVKAMVFPVVMYGCESWTVKKAER